MDDRALHARHERDSAIAAGPPPLRDSVRIIGVDPGSRATGYGVVDFTANRSVHVASGTVHTRGEDMAARLHQIFVGLGEVIDAFAPAEMAVERVFVARNPDSALKLGQARGVAMVAGTSHGLGMAEYSALEVKQAVTGRGRAEKSQVQHMIRVLLCLPEPPAPDQADALAVALCHGHTRETALRVARSGRTTAGAGT